MATVESLTRRLDKLDENRRYYRIEDIILAQPMAGESLIQTLQREHPGKDFDPAMVASCLKHDSP